jgi:hypothetical protein
MVLDSDKIKDPIASMNQIKIINHKEKNDWILEAKYNMGRKKNNG